MLNGNFSKILSQYLFVVLALLFHASLDSSWPPPTPRALEHVCLEESAQHVKRVELVQLLAPDECQALHPTADFASSHAVPNMLCA